MNEDGYHIIKTSISAITYIDSNVSTILNHYFVNVTGVVSHMYQFLRLLLLYEYMEKRTLTRITMDIICICIKILTKDTNYGSSSDKSQTEYEYLNNFYNDHYKQLGYSDKIDGYNLNQLLLYEGKQMITAINNNIKFNFNKYIKRFVIISFQEKHNLFILLTKKENKDKLKREHKSDLKAIINDLLYNEQTSNPKYWDWINNIKPLIMPNFKDSYINDIHKNPQKYLPYMIMMSKYFEKYGEFQYQFFPQRSSDIPCYCTLDTTSLIRLLINDSANRNKYLANPTEYQGVIWQKCFNMKSKVFKETNNLKFDYTILTDGVGVSIRFVTEEQYRLNLISENNKKDYKNHNKYINTIEDSIEKELIDKSFRKHKQIENEQNYNVSIEREKVMQTNKDFLYIEELTDEQKEELKNSIRIYDDPGKNKLATMKNEEGTTLIYSNQQRLKETNRQKYANQIKKFWGIDEDEEDELNEEEIIKIIKKKRKRNSKKKRKKGQTKNKGKPKHLLGKKDSIEFKKRNNKHIKQNTNQSSINLIIKKTPKEKIIIEDILNKINKININEQKDVETNINHFNKILKDNTNQYLGINYLVFENLISFAILNQNRNIYNKYGNERKILLKDIKKFGTEIGKKERIFNKTYTSIKNFIDNIIKLDEDKKIELINMENEEEYLMNKKRVELKYKNLILQNVNNLSKANLSNLEIKSEITKLLELFNKYNYNDKKILNDKLRMEYSMDQLINENIMEYSKDKCVKIQQICMAYQLSTDNIFTIFKNILYDIKTSIYNCQTQEKNIIAFIQNERSKDILSIKQTNLEKWLSEHIRNKNKGYFNMNHTNRKINEILNKIYKTKKDIATGIVTLSKYLKIMWTINTDKIKGHINSIPHPDPTYISFLIMSTNKEQLLINKKKIALNLERDLSYCRIKSCNIEKYEFYITYKNYIRKSDYGDIYHDKLFRRNKWYSYIDNQRSLDKFLDRIELTFGPRDKIIIIYGDWSMGQHLRGFMPTPMISLKRKIHSRFKIYNIDEFRTSVLSAKTGKVCENIMLPDKYGKLRSIHSILTYKSGLRINCINRDCNAIDNFQIITTEYLAGRPRPARFCRTTKLDDYKEITSNPKVLSGRSTPRSSISMSVKNG